MTCHYSVLVIIFLAGAVTTVRWLLLLSYYGEAERREVRVVNFRFLHSFGIRFLDSS